MNTDTTGRHVAVVGSVNLDIVARVERFPAAGETVTGAEVRRFPGGKGANQALAARRLGARVTMLACVGEDPVAAEALAGLREAGVDLGRCRTLPGVATGLALITVVATGENRIVVAPGANAAFDPDLLDLPAADAVIAQLEVPMATVQRAAEECTGFFCLNAAPARDVTPEVLRHTGLLVVNEVEARMLAGRLRDYAGLLAVTLGAEGAVLYRGGVEVARARPPRVEVVDTTGAGDAFTAALVVGMIEGLAPEAALRRACVAGALTAARPGAQSCPGRTDVERLMSDPA